MARLDCSIFWSGLEGKVCDTEGALLREGDGWDGVRDGLFLLAFCGVR